MISRRDFLRYCGISAAALGLSSLDLLNLKEALANPGGAFCNLASGKQLHGLFSLFFEQNILDSA